MKLALLTSTLAAALASATPLVSRATEMCGDWDNVVVQDYTLYNNLWGKGSATSGSQCTTLDSSSGSTIKWHSAWSWAGGQYNVKSYPNVVVKTQQVPISKIKSIPTTWNWSYTGTGLVTDVAYDLFTSDTAGGAEKFELMVWLANINAGPISSTYSAEGKPVPIASATLEGHTWDVYKGPNGDMTVFSFLPAGGKQINSFSGDINKFFAYLVKSQGLSNKQFLKSVGAGTEPFLGDKAVFTTKAYSVKVNYA